MSRDTPLACLSENKGFMWSWDMSLTSKGMVMGLAKESLSRARVSLPRSDDFKRRFIYLPRACGRHGSDMLPFLTFSQRTYVLLHLNVFQDVALNIDCVGVERSRG